MDKVVVNFGCEILKIIPGRVSTEIDARLSYDAENTIKRAKRIIKLYEEKGFSSDRILLKIASTWEGFKAAEALEKEGLHVNMTLIFSVIQAMVAGEAKVTLVSPFAGRITDFYKQKDKVDQYEPAQDPGVKSVKEIFNYLKTYKYATTVMGASFRSIDQVKELAGCDLLTVSPKLLDELAKSDKEVPRKLFADQVTSSYPKTVLTEKEFRWRINNDEMADFKLNEGIRKFAADLVKLEDLIKPMLA